LFQFAQSIVSHASTIPSSLTSPLNIKWPKKVTGEGTIFQGAPSPCGDDWHHYFCRQLGFCIFAHTPEGFVATKWDKINAILMASSFWLFLVTAVPAACMYPGNDQESAIGASLQGFRASLPNYPFFKIWCIAIAANSALSVFPTYWCITICNLFKAKIIANQAWCSALLFISISFLYQPFDGFSFMMFGMGWSVSMFTVTAGKVPNLWAHGNLLAIAAAVGFVSLVPCLASTAAAAGTMTTFHVFFFSACFFFGFMVWSSMEGYAHVHQFAVSPDARMLSWKGPIEVQVPMSSEVPEAWGGALLPPNKDLL